jgi:hypothetical protein
MRLLPVLKVRIDVQECFAFRAFHYKHKVATIYKVIVCFIMFINKACKKSRVTMKWDPFGNRSAEAEHFFNEHHTKNRHYGPTP